MSEYVKDLIEEIDSIDNQKIKLYIKEILLNAVQQFELSDHFVELFEQKDYPKVRILNPLEFKD